MRRKPFRSNRQRIFLLDSRATTMTATAPDIRSAREAAERMLEELGLDAFVYTVEAKEGGWDLRVDCATEEGWQTVELPVEPVELIASLGDARLREALRARWGAHLRACVKRDPRAAAAGLARWEHFPHGADIGVRGFGATKAEAFEQAARAMTAVIADLELVAPREAVRIECEAPDDELLLAEWLNALVYEMATRKMLFSRFAVKLEGTRLRAEARGEPVDVGRHHPAVEVKGATYTMLRVAREAGGWLAQTVVDV
jgi:SHS2 domain-containing protein